MKRTYRKTVVRTIRQSLSRFLAIFAIVALGVGFLAGLLATTPDMRYSADRFFDETDLFDLRIVGTLGLTDEDVEAVRAIDGVEQVMPAYSSDAIVNTPLRRRTGGPHPERAAGSDRGKGAPGLPEPDGGGGGPACR